eukprot:303970_1
MNFFVISPLPLILKVFQIIRQCFKLLNVAVIDDLRAFFCPVQFVLTIAENLHVMDWRGLVLDLKRHGDGWENSEDRRPLHDGEKCEEKIREMRAAEEQK